MDTLAVTDEPHGERSSGAATFLAASARSGLLGSSGLHGYLVIELSVRGLQGRPEGGHGTVGRLILLAHVTQTAHLVLASSFKRAAGAPEWTNPFHLLAPPASRRLKEWKT